jgi:CDP-diacylglycerol--serine O-phosphatidyltransferase
MKVTRAVVPSLFTVLNIFCGFLAIVNTSRGEYDVAAWLIIAAGIFDVLDGAMARITKSFSDFGVELDSLADVVSFGVAPSFLVYSIYLHNLNGVGMLISAMPMVFGAMRLARFNAQIVGYDKDYFRGLPIPSTAIVIASFVQHYFSPAVGIDGAAAPFLAPLVVMLSLLMVSTIQYDAMPKFSRRGIMQHPLRFTFVVVGLTAIVLTQGTALFPFFVLYVITGPLRFVFKYMKTLAHGAGKRSEEDAEINSVDI